MIWSAFLVGSASVHTFFRKCSLNKLPYCPLSLEAQCPSKLQQVVHRWNLQHGGVQIEACLARLLRQQADLDGAFFYSLQHRENFALWILHLPDVLVRGKAPISLVFDKIIIS